MSNTNNENNVHTKNIILKITDVFAKYFGENNKLDILNMMNIELAVLSIMLGMTINRSKTYLNVSEKQIRSAIDKYIENGKEIIEETKKIK